MNDTPRIALIPIVSVLASLFLASPAVGEVAKPKITPQQALTMAQKAEKEGDYETALKLYKRLSDYRPGDPRLQAAYKRTLLKIREDRPRATLEAKLSAVMIPAVEFHDTPYRDAMDFLAQRVTELTNGEVRPNFIYKGSTEQRDRNTITLQLTQTPVTEIIRYIGELTGTKFKYETYAVVGSPVLSVNSSEFSGPSSSNSLFDD